MGDRSSVGRDEGHGREALGDADRACDGRDIGLSRRTWSARILCELQISSLSLYMEMPEAHANPNAKLVMRVPNMF